MFRRPLPAGINAQAYRERDLHVCGSCGCDLGSRFRSRAGFLVSVFGLKFDDGVSRFRLVSSQVGRIGVAPIRKIYNPRYLRDGHLNPLLNFLHQRMQRTNDFNLGTSSVASRDTVAAKRSFMMTCLELALTAQLICVSGQTIVCTDNGSIAQLLGVPGCTITERSRPNDDHRQIQAQRD